MKVVAFNGSPRQESNTALLIREVFRELETEGIETELIELRKSNLHGCLACFKCFASPEAPCAINTQPGMTGYMGISAILSSRHRSNARDRKP